MGAETDKSARLFFPRPGGLRLSPRQSAVLPFRQFQRRPGAGFFADGITEDIISMLAGGAPSL